MGLANDMSKAELKRVVEVLTLWMADLLAVGQGVSARFFAAQTSSIQQTIERLDIERAAQFAAQLSQMARVAEHPLSARTQCEALLLEYKAIFN
jgi:hypothetical protein